MSANSYNVNRQTARIQNTQKTGIGGWGTAAGQIAAAPMANPFGALGAPARPSQLSGFAQVMGGGSGHGPIDMSDFPSLSGRSRPQQSNGASAVGWNSSAIRQPSTQTPPVSSQHQQRTPSAAPPQQTLEQYESQRSNERAGSAEDFPSLNSRINGEGLSQPNGFASSLESPEMQLRQSNSQQAQLPIRQNNAAYSTNQQAPIGQLSQSQLTLSRNGKPTSQSTGITKYADMTENEKWGLPGLMAALEARRQAENGGPIDDTLPPAMRSSMFMGQDLNDLGMTLDSQEPLYTTFTPFPVVGSSGSTYDFHDRHVVPDFTLPSAYTVTNVPPLSSRMAAFSDETLFSIFYQSPRDIAQELAAQELTAREWRWHKVLRQWLQKDTRESNTSSSLPLVDLANGALIGAQPVRVGERSERGVYIFFDAANWQRERREFVLDYEQLDHHRNPAAPTNGSSMGVGGVAPGMHNGLLGMPQAQQQTVS